MAGRKANLVSYQGKMLYKNGGATTVRVGISKSKNREMHILWDGKKKVLARKKLEDIAAEFYKYIGEGVDITKHITVGWKPTGQILNYPAPDGTTKRMQVRKPAAKITPDEICNMFAQIYIADPYKAELLSGIPNLSKLSTIDFAWHKAHNGNGANGNGSNGQIPMTDVLTAYTLDPAYVDKSHLVRAANQYWQEFTAIINRQAGRKIKYLNDIEPEWVKIWEQEINKVATTKGYMEKAYWLSLTQRQESRKDIKYPRNTWQRKRVMGISGLVRHYRESKILKPDDSRLQVIRDLEYVLKSVKRFKKSVRLAKTATVEDFEKLYTLASLRMKLVLCLGVQCSFTQIDCYNLKKCDIDWKTGELNKQREKEDMPRLAVISPFVLQMLKDYMEQHDNNSEYIFVEKGKRITPAAMGKAFNKIRQKADVTPTLKYLRKTALTTAGAMGASEVSIKLLAGHSTHIQDHYIEKTVEQVKGACELIAEKYFTNLEK